MQATAVIRQLDDATIAQIAAGEVIERPVSVVKELVENSLDAGATHVAVEVEEGGRSLIAVADDGAGMPRDQLALALRRHATSKLVAAEDLFAVRTLGFRGEGLASIAAAGSVEVVSRPRGAEMGARIEARGTHIGETSAHAAPPGTKVTVRDLFALTPARREFIKSARAEFSRISGHLSQLALGWPRVTFALRHDGREVWTLPGVSDPVDRLEMVFGKGARGALVTVPPPDVVGRESVSGHVSAPGHDRTNRSQQVFFVNGRLVRSPALAAAWLAGYGSFGMTGRYPFGVLLLDLPPEDVDVNVHPTKIEVRFAHARAVFESVRLSVARTLRAVEPVRSMPASVFEGGAALASDGGEAIPLVSVLPQTAVAQNDARVYGQIDRTFIVAGGADGLIVIDQHAAHERIAYEALLKTGAEAPALQTGAQLLIPMLVELTAAQAAVLHDHDASLREAGVVVEEFGDNGAYRIVSLPAGYERRRFDLPGVLEDLVADEAPREGVAHRNRLLATIACHSVVRAHEPLTLLEQSALYERLLRCDEPHTCPHGRPTMLRLDAPALAKAFRRT